MKLIVILCLLLGFAISFPAAAEKRVALVIGNANYKTASELPNDLNDAKDMADVLRGYGFKVIPKMDADLTTTLKALDELGDELKNGGVGLFYYSGHGLEVDGQQYIVPVDAHLTSKTELPYRMINVNTILAKVGESKSQLNVVILDACRNNPYAKSLGIKSLNKGFSQIQNAPSGTLIASATAVGDTSSASGARNSVYTAHLLQYLRAKPNDEIRLLLGDVGTSVKTATGSDQVPWVSGSIDGRFYFAPDVAASIREKPVVQETISIPTDSQKKSELVTSYSGFKVTKKPKLYVVAIGISQYDRKTLNLPYSAKDAQDVANVLENDDGFIYSEVKLKLLTDANATKIDILNGLDWLQKQVTANDVAIVFLSGHGINDNNGLYYFLPSDSGTVVEDMKRSGVSYEAIKDVLINLPSKVIMFSDACPGNAIGGHIMDNLHSELASAENGVIVFSACSEEDYMSYESSALKNGQFTKALVEGLQGNADYSKDNQITIDELYLYVHKRVKELSDNKQIPALNKPRTVQDFTIFKARIGGR